MKKIGHLIIFDAYGDGHLKVQTTAVHIWLHFVSLEPLHVSHVMTGYINVEVPVGQDPDPILWLRTRWVCDLDCIVATESQQITARMKLRYSPADC